MTQLSKEEAVKELSRLVTEFEFALREAQSFAEEHDLGFSICPEYGMGGYFDGEQGEWSASSTNC